MNYSAFLFSKSTQRLGVLLTLFSVVLGYFVVYHEFRWAFLEIPGWTSILIKGIYIEVNLTDELAMIGLITGLFFIGFGKVRDEDERVLRFRLESLQWAIVVQQTILLVLFLINNLVILPPEALFGSWSLLGDMGWLIYMVFAPLVLFILRFRFVLWRDSRNHLDFRPTSNALHPIVLNTILVSSIVLFLLVVSQHVLERADIVSSLFPDPVWQSAWYIWPCLLVFYLALKPTADREFEVALKLQRWKYSFVGFYAFMIVCTCLVNGSAYLLVLLGQVVLLPVLYLFILPILNVFPTLSNQHNHYD